MIITYKAEDLRDPLDSLETYLRTEWSVVCDGVPCQHPAAPDAPAHQHVIASGQFPYASDQCYAIWSE